MKLKLPQKKTQFLAFALLMGAFLSLALENFKVTSLKAALYDLRVFAENLIFPAKTNTNIALLLWDEEFENSQTNTHPIAAQTRLLDQLKYFKPKAIGYVLDFNDLGVDPQNSRAELTAFFKKAKELEALGIPVIIATDIDLSGQVLPPAPLDQLKHRIGVIHKDGNHFAKDKVTRRAFFKVFNENSFHAELANRFTSKSREEDYRGIVPMNQLDSTFFLIHFKGRTELGKHPFTETSFSEWFGDHLSIARKKTLFQDKIILVGSESKADANLYTLTPFSKEPLINPKLVVHAHIIETLITNSAIVGSSDVVCILITFFLTALIVFVVFHTSPAKGLVITFALSFILLLISMPIFIWNHRWIPLAHPLISLFASYYLFVPYRLIIEYKQRAQLQRRNEVLSQVEELKSNFMNLITHDLKTPVARIQGLAEILKKNTTQPEVVSQILSSSEELNHFISSILELARIESNRVKLDKTTKDVNRILEDAVRKFEFQARNKKITLMAELEPLFPIPIDVHLISRVISNLIDNAIKYSPEGSTVRILSSESETRTGFIEISIVDNGPGMTKETQENLFSKFYRPKSDLSIQNKGFGVGLYLSRYFVELHQGSLNVESEVGHGTTFTLLLPESPSEHQTDEQIEDALRIKFSSKKETNSTPEVDNHV